MKLSMLDYLTALRDCEAVRRLRRVPDIRVDRTSRPGLYRPAHRGNRMRFHRWRYRRALRHAYLSGAVLTLREVYAMEGLPYEPA